MEGRVWSTEYSSAVPCTLDIALQSEHSIQSCETLVAAPNTNLMTKCEIDCHSGSAENCSLEVARSTKNWSTRFIFMRKGCLHGSADWIGYNKSSCYASWYFSISQTTTWWHCPSCVTTRCCLFKDLVSLKSKWSTFLCLHGLIFTALHCTY